MVASLRVLARKKRMRLVLTKGHYHGGQQENKIYATRRTLGNAILREKYFRARHYTTDTNYHLEMVFFLLSKTWLGYGIKINRRINFS